jgi:hypothetical protein
VLVLTFLDLGDSRRMELNIGGYEGLSIIENDYQITDAGIKILTEINILTFSVLNLPCCSIPTISRVLLSPYKRSMMAKAVLPNL